WLRFFVRPKPGPPRRPVACRAIVCAVLPPMGSFSAGFVLGMLGTYISVWLNGYRRIAPDQASMFSFELLQFPVVAQPFPNCGDGTINNIRTATPTAKVKPWTSKIILENYTLKRALPAHAPDRSDV